MNNLELLKQVDPFVYDEIFNWNVYQASRIEMQDANVLDVGGHYGLYSCLAHSLGAKRIIAIEANPYNYLHYVKNTLDITNGKVINAAVSSESGKLVTIDNNSEKSTVGKGDINVATVTLSEVVTMFPENEDIVLKMDIEGAEIELLEHLISTGSIALINILYIEFHSEYQSPDASRITKQREDIILEALSGISTLKVRIWH